MPRITDLLRPTSAWSDEDRAAHRARKAEENERRRQENLEKYIVRMVKMCKTQSGEAPLLALALALDGHTSDTIARDTGHAKALIQAVLGGHVPLSLEMKMELLSLIEAEDQEEPV